MKKYAVIILALLIAALCGCGKLPGDDKPVEPERELSQRQRYYAFCCELLAGERPIGEKFHGSADVLILRREGGALNAYEPDAPKKPGVEQKLTFIGTLDALPSGITLMEMEENVFHGYLSGDMLMLVAEKGGSFDTVILRRESAGGWTEIGSPEEAFGRYLTGGAFIGDEVGFACYEGTRDPETGIADPHVYATFDGGSTWQLLDSVAMPERYYSQLGDPTFLSPVFEGEHGVLPAIAVGDRDIMIWFETLDGGHNWIFRGCCDGRTLI